MKGNQTELDQLRIAANEKISNVKSPSMKETVLTPNEELSLVRSYLFNLREFCRKFQPPMGKSVIATAFIFMKRFYLHESCMEHHPRDIGVTCAYLACKIDEFNVTIDQFIKNIQGDRKKAQKTILSNELMLMKKLNFQFIVHLPFRPVEGFLIDLRARYPPARDKTDLLLKEIEEFLEKSMYTDACFLFAPSQIALAAVYHAAQICDLNLKDYLKKMVFADDQGAYEYFKRAYDCMQQMNESDQQNIPTKEAIKKIEKKLQEVMTS